MGNIWILQGGNILVLIAQQCKGASPALLKIPVYFANRTWFFLLIPRLVFVLMGIHGILHFKLANNVKFHFAKIA